MIGDLRCNSIDMQLIRSDAILSKQLIRDQRGSRAVSSIGKLHSVNHGNVLHGFVRDVLEHFHIRAYRDHLHYEMVLGRGIVCDV